MIDVNRDPAGGSLYPGQATTELCPTMTFDGEPLYRETEPCRATEIEHRTERWFQPYHDALSAEIDRLRSLHARVVLYDCHSIRSSIPRLFVGRLPQFNLGTNDGASCAHRTDYRGGGGVRRDVARPRHQRPVQGRLDHAPLRETAAGVHAIQMELACRGYLAEPIGPVDDENWPVPFE